MAEKAGKDLNSKIIGPFSLVLREYFMNRFVIGVMFLLIANSGLGDSATKKVWDATSGNFITGELTYGDIHWTTGPGESVTLRSAQDLLRGAREAQIGSKASK